jgi:hypothetical protein
MSTELLEKILKHIKSKIPLTEKELRTKEYYDYEKQLAFIKKFIVREDEDYFYIQLSYEDYIQLQKELLKEEIDLKFDSPKQQIFYSLNCNYDRMCGTKSSIIEKNIFTIDKTNYFVCLHN